MKLRDTALGTTAYIKAPNTAKNVSIIIQIIPTFPTLEMPRISLSSAFSLVPKFETY
jgi:hypothetical protein